MVVFGEVSVKATLKRRYAWYLARMLHRYFFALCSSSVPGVGSIRLVGYLRLALFHLPTSTTHTIFLHHILSFFLYFRSSPKRSSSSSSRSAGICGIRAIGGAGITGIGALSILETEFGGVARVIGIKGWGWSARVVSRVGSVARVVRSVGSARKSRNISSSKKSCRGAVHSELFK